MLTNTPRKIIVHHTANSTQTPQFAMTNAYHEQQGFILSTLGYYVGYHYFIERDGTVLAARKDTDEGCHTIGQNTTSLGIGLAGNFDIEQPTSAQLNSLAQLLTEKMALYNLAPEDIYGHRDFVPKDCPGSNLSDDKIRYLALKNTLSWFSKLIQWLKLILNL